MIKLLFILLIFYCPLFWRVTGQQLEIKLPHFTVIHHLHYIAWVKFEAIPSKILSAIGSSYSLCRPTAGLFPFALASKACLGSFSCVILRTWPNHLSRYLSIQRSVTALCLEILEFQSYICTLFNSVTPSILCKNLISNAFTCDRTLLGITHDS